MMKWRHIVTGTAFSFVFSYASNIVSQDSTLRTGETVRFGSIDATMVRFGGYATPECMFAVSNDGKYFFFTKVGSTCERLTDAEGKKIVCNSDRSVCKSREEIKEAIFRRHRRPNEIYGVVTGLDEIGGDGFLAVRTRPGGAMIAKLYNGDELEILGYKGKWYRIKRISDGTTGWSYYKWIEKRHKLDMIKNDQENNDMPSSSQRVKMSEDTKEKTRTWQKTYGEGEGYALALTKNGDIVVAGSAESDGNDDAIVIRTDRDGNTIWQKRFDENKNDKATAIVTQQSGETVVSYVTYRYGWHSRIVKIGKNGKVRWKIPLRLSRGSLTKDGSIAKVQDMISTKQHAIIAVGYIDTYETRKNIFVIKTNGTGETLWEKFYGGKGDDEANAVALTQDGGMVIAGYTESYGMGRTEKKRTLPGGVVIKIEDASSDLFVVKIDEKGNTIWRKTFGGEKNDRANAIVATKDGGCVAVGYTESFGSEEGRGKIYVVKIDRNGDKVWEKVFGNESLHEANDIVQTVDGGFLIVGQSYAKEDGYGDLYLLKIDNNGAYVWDRTYGGFATDVANAVVAVKNGGFVITGGLDANICVMRVDEKGALR